MKLILELIKCLRQGNTPWTKIDGRLAFDNEMKQTNNGHAVISNRLAVERNYKDAQGNRDTDFINVVFWRQQAEALNQYAKKGDLIGVQGRLRVRSYENQQGQRVEVVEVVVNELPVYRSKSNERARVRYITVGGLSFLFIY